MLTHQTASTPPCSTYLQASYIHLIELCVRASQPRLAVQLCAEVSGMFAARRRATRF